MSRPPAIVARPVAPARVPWRELLPRDRVARIVVVGALVAPMDLKVVKSLTLFDVLLAVAGIMLVRSGRRVQPLPRLFFPAAFTFLFFALASCLRATHPIEAITQFGQFGFILLVELPVLLTVVTTKRMLHLMLGALTAGTLFGIVVSFLMQQAAGAGRIAAFFSDNPNRLGYPLAYLLPFVLHHLAVVWGRGQKRRAIVTGVAVIYPLVWAVAASATRGGATAAVVSFLIYVVFVGGRRGAVRRFTIAVVSVVVVIGTVYMAGLVPATLEERVARSFAGGENATELLEDRENLAIAAGRAIADSPFLGTGLDNFKFVAQWYETRATPQAPHNVWLALTAQVGVIGTLGFVFIIATWFELLLRRRHRAENRVDLRLTWAFLCSMVGILMIFMATPLMIHRHYWLIYGLGLALFAMPAEPPDPDPSTDAPARSVTARTARRLGATA